MQAPSEACADARLLELQLHMPVSKLQAALQARLLVGQRPQSPKARDVFPGDIPTWFGSTASDRSNPRQEGSGHEQADSTGVSTGWEVRSVAVSCRLNLIVQAMVGLRLGFTPF